MPKYVPASLELYKAALDDFIAKSEFLRHHPELRDPDNKNKLRSLARITQHLLSSYLDNYAYSNN